MAYLRKRWKRQVAKWDSARLYEGLFDLDKNYLPDGKRRFEIGGKNYATIEDGRDMFTVEYGVSVDDDGTVRVEVNDIRRQRGIKRLSL